MASKGTSRKKTKEEPEGRTTVAWRVETTIHSRNPEEFEKKKSALLKKLQSSFELVEESDPDTVSLEDEAEDDEDEDDTGEELCFDND